MNFDLDQAHHSNIFLLQPLTPTLRTRNTAIMSDWIGPNNYRIESFQNRGAAIAVRADTTNVVQK
jgi:hypothetical protein